MTDELGARLCDYVALRKESVDRNLSVFRIASKVFMSLSARRAWIEISRAYEIVADDGSSLSARRAWIEISYQGLDKYQCDSRSPQGERG